MSNPHIESLLFEANTLDGQHPIHLHFHDIGQIDTVENVFYDDNGFSEPVACHDSSLHLLEPEQVFEVSLKNDC